MTDEKAHELAKARWGTRAFATKTSLSNTIQHVTICKVGRIKDNGKGTYAQILGFGFTWEAAFRHADAHEAPACGRPRR